MNTFTTSRSGRVRPVLAAMAALVLASGCATSGVNRGDFNMVSVQEEWQLGRQIEQQMASQVKLVNDPTAVAYITQIGKKIVAQTEMANRPWKFFIVADPSINAFNTPGGLVYVHTGLIQAVDNVAELASVMAHEIAHGVSRHGTERLSAAQGANVGAAVLLGRNPGAFQQMLAQIGAGGLFARFSRNDEREADLLGVRYLYQAGYDPNAMITMFQKLQSENQRRPGRVEQFFSTHPLTQDRIEDMRGEVQQLPRRKNAVTRDSGLAGTKQRLARYASR